MRVAIVHENWGAGAARCARDLQAGLTERHEVIYFPRDERENSASVLAGLAEFRPDVVNCHSVYGGLPYGILAEISRKYPTCFTVHDPRPVGALEPICWTCERNTTCLRCPLIEGPINKILRNKYFVSRSRKRWTHYTCNREMIIATPSQWMKQRLEKQELSRFKINHVPNGIDFNKFRPMESQRERFHLPEKGRVILHLAWHAGQWSINDRKGMRYLAEAFINKVLPKYPDTHLAIAGESFAPNHPNVRGLGMVDQSDLPSLFSSVDIFVSPTVADNFPYTILEAMACGKAVIASDVGGIPEQVENGATGMLVKPRDSEGIGESINRLLAQPGLMQEYGNAAREKVVRKFGMATFVGTYESIFEKLTKSTAKPLQAMSPGVAVA
jgi:glycosyltransferase involved in cell wall biosynthesis